MSTIVLTGDTSGAITLASPAVAGSNTITLPAATGTAMVSGNMPTFSAYQSSAQTITFSVATKIQFQTEEWDTNNNYDNATNYRFTPTVAGYYLVQAVVSANVSGNGYSYPMIYKNGALYANGVINATAGQYAGVPVQRVVYFNGSTDYVEIYYVSAGSGTFTTQNGSTLTWFQASMVRTA